MAYLNSIAILVLAGAVMYNARSQRLTTITLNHVRCATFELVSILDDRIGDVEQSLREAGIPTNHDRVNERIRRMKLSPSERRDEDLARFNEVCQRLEHLRHRDEN